MSWRRLARVLVREGADPKVSRSFYTSVSQKVLLFGAETWVLTRKMDSALDAFQVRAARRLAGRQPCRVRDGLWFYPSLAGAMKEAGVVRIRTSILRRQNTVAHFIATRPILGLCEVAERRPGTRVPRRRWGQTGIDWKAAREKAAAKDGDDEAEAADPDLTGSDSEPEAATPGGTAGGTGEYASLGASRSSEAERSGVGWRIDLLDRDSKIIDHVVTLKYIKGQSLECNIAAALVLELHHPIMSKLWGLRDQTNRQTVLQVILLIHKAYYSTISHISHKSGITGIFR